MGVLCVIQGYLYGRLFVDKPHKNYVFCMQLNVCQDIGTVFVLANLQVGMSWGLTMLFSWFLKIFIDKSVCTFRQHAIDYKTELLQY